MILDDRIEEAAWELLGAMGEAEGARDMDDKQYARQECMRAATKLRKALYDKDNAR